MDRSSYINKFFNRVYVITCNNLIDRQIYIKNHFSKNNIKFEFVESWDKYIFSDGDVCAAQKSLISSHIRCILDAKIHKLNNILICEDDAYFVENFESEFNKFINILPEDWDYIQLGNQIWAAHWLRRTKIKENLYRFFWGTGSHGVGIKQSVFDETIKMLQTYKSNSDIMYYELFKNKNCYCSENFLIDALSENSHLNYIDKKQIFKSTMNHKKLI